MRFEHNEFKLFFKSFKNHLHIWLNSLGSVHFFHKQGGLRTQVFCRTLINAAVSEYSSNFFSAHIATKFWSKKTLKTKLIFSKYIRLIAKISSSQKYQFDLVYIQYEFYK